jgi:tetratricopeptide (TPR) repeat protein
MLEATANPFAQTTPFFAIVELLRSYFGVDQGYDAVRTKEKISARLAGLAVSRDVAAVVGALLSPAMETEQFRMLDPQERRDRMVSAVKELLVSESLVQPLLLVMDDLQAADSETLRCLDAVVAALPGARICVLMTYRPEFQHRWTGKSYYTELRVDPLSAASVALLLDSLLGRDTLLMPVRERLVQRTEGNPFFIEESVRMLADLGVLAGERGAYAIVRPVPELPVPDTVQAVLGRRIDRLPPAEKRLLQCAAVVGKDVTFGLLGAVSELPPAELRTLLGRLQVSEFLFESRVFPEPEFTFRHPLTHEVTYASLLLERRRDLHARALAAMEARAGDERANFAEAMARQAIGGEVWDKAVDYLRLSGARAYARGALRKALERYEQALALLPRLAAGADNVRRDIDVRLDLHAPLFSLGQIPRLVELHQTARTLAEGLNDKPRLGRVCSRLGTYAFTGGEYASGVAYAERALTISEETDDVDTGIIGLYLLGMNHVALGYVRRGADFFLRIVHGEHAERSKHISGLSAAPYVLACSWLAGAYAMQGAFERAHLYAEHGVRAADESDHPYAQAIAYSWRVIPIAHRGGFAEALPLCESAVQLCEKKELLGWLPMAYALWGWVLAWSGRATEGVPLIERAVTLFEAVGIRAFLGLRYVEWAEALLLDGRPEEARATATRAVEISVAQAERANETWARCLLGDIALATAPVDVETALAHYEQARATADALALAPLLARCRLGLGRAHARLGDLEAAREELAAARAFYSSAGSDYWIARVDDAA